MGRLRYQAPVVAYAVLIFGLSAIPGKGLPTPPFVSFDKLLHVLEFGLFGYLLALAFQRGGSKFMQENWLVIALVVGLLYAASDEWHQHFVPGRTPSVADILADGVGLIAAQALYRFRLARAKDPSDSLSAKQSNGSAP